MNRETRRNKDDKAQEHDQGIRKRSGWCSSLRVLVQLTESAGWWLGDDDSHGVEISIAGGVRKMVRESKTPFIATALPTTLTLSLIPESHDLMTHIKL